MFNFTSRPLYPRARTPVHIKQGAEWAPESIRNLLFDEYQSSVPGIRWSEREADHSPPSSFELRN